MAEFHLPKEVPPSINGEVFACPPGLENDADLLAIKAALNTAKAHAEKALQAAQGIHRNEMLTVHSRHRQARDTAMKITKPALQKVDATRSHVVEVLNRLKASTAAPRGPRDASERLLANAICDRLDRMDPAKRTSIIATAIKTQDDVTVAAILTAPAYLSGLDPIEHQRFREDWRRNRLPEETARIDSLESGLEHLERGGALLVSFAARLYGHAIVAAGEKSEREANEALRQAGAA